MYSLNPLKCGFKFFVVVLQLSSGVHLAKSIPSEAVARKVNDILERHNTYRECHNAPPLQLDPKLSEVAQQEADALAGNKTKLHSSLHTSYNGLNIFVKPSVPRISSAASRATQVNPADVWYEEGRLYRPGDSTYLSDHFTQMLWKSTEKLGVGVAESDDGGMYVVCKYEPVGNIDGQYEQNVFEGNQTIAAKNTICVPDIFTNPMTTTTPTSFNNTASSKIEPQNNGSVNNATDTTSQPLDTKDVALYFIILVSIFSILLTTTLVLIVLFTLRQMLKSDTNEEDSSGSSRPSTIRYSEPRDAKTYPRSENPLESSTTTSYNGASYM